MRRFLAVTLALSVLAPLLSVAPAVLPEAPLTVRAAGAGCLDDNGNEVPCPITVDPIPLPIGQTMGEYELALVTRGGGGTLTVLPREFKTGSDIGSCVPLNANCDLSDQAYVGPLAPDPVTGQEAPSLATMGSLTGAQRGDAAVTTADFDANGQQEIVTGGRCEGSTELCLSVYDPSTNSYATRGRTWFRSGVYLSSGVGRIRLASGMLLRTSATITGVGFSLNPSGGVLATFTTASPHNYIVGQPVRFQDDASLAQAMCPALAEGSVLCGSGLSAAWVPVEGVPSSTEFTVRIGNAIDASGAAGEEVGEGEEAQATGPQIPDPWPSVPGTTLGVTGLRPGVVAAISGPGKTATLAVFQVRLGRLRQFRLVDEIPVGRLPQSATSRDPLEVGVADFDGDGQDEIVVAWVGSNGQGLLRFFSTSEAKQMLPLGPTSSWAGSAVDPYFVSIATGSFVSIPSSNTRGADVAVAWGRSDTGGHEMRVLDVTQNYGIRSMAYEGGFPEGTTFRGDWEPDTTYNAGDIVRDELGFWRTSEGGRAKCTTDQGESTRFYFPDPVTGASSWNNRLPKEPSGTNPDGTTRYVTSWPDPSGWSAPVPGEDVVLQDPKTLGVSQNGAARGFLDPQPPNASDMKIALHRWGTQTRPFPRDHEVMLGQYVSAPLAAQTLSGRAEMVMAAGWQAPEDTWARAQLRIRVVRNDGSERTGQENLVFDGVDGNELSVGDDTYNFSPALRTNSLPGSTVPGATFADGQPRSFGMARHVPATDENPRTVGLNEVEVRAGDRLVIEFGLVTNLNGEAEDTTNDPRSGMWVGAIGRADMPSLGNAFPYNTNVADGNWLDPWINFTQSIRFDNCANHVSDEGVHDWVPVPATERLEAFSGYQPADSANVALARNSTVRLAAGDLDFDGLDDLALVHTTPSTASPSSAPVEVQVWRGQAPDCGAPQSPGAAAACPVRNGTARKMTFERVVDADPGALGAVVGSAAGANGAGQLSIAAGRVGVAPGEPSFPNSVNADLVLSWSSGAGTSIVPVDVCVPGLDADQNGSDDICPTDVSWSVIDRRTVNVTGGPLLSNKDWSTTEIALADLDRDSKTIGAPLEYLETDRLQPMLILRAPPVHYDVFDIDGDGTITRDETYDVNKCFSDFIATENQYVCSTYSSYGTSSTVTSTVQAEVHTAGAYTWGGDLTANLGGGFNQNGCTGGKGEAVKIADTDAGSQGFCVEGLLFVNMSSENRVSSDSAEEIGRSFSYTSTVTTRAGSDAVYAALQQNEVLEYPVYAGAGWGLGAGEPLQYITQKSPLRTRFLWMSSQDFDLPLTAHGQVPQQVLSYAPTETQLRRGIPAMKISSVSQDPTGNLVVTLRKPHNLSCNRDSVSADEPITIGVEERFAAVRQIDTNRFGANRWPCVVGAENVEVQETKTPLDRAYIVAQALGEHQLLLQPTVPLGTVSPGVLGRAGGGSVYVSPGGFPAEEWTVRRFNTLEAEVVSNTESGYERSYGWGIGSQLDIEARISAAAALAYVVFGVSGGFNYSETYSKDVLQTLSIGTTQETRFGVSVASDIKPNISYRIRPFLVQSPGGAMVLDWTTSVDETQPFWQLNYGLLPDLGFALPNLLTPYKAPFPLSRPRATVPVLLESTSFGSWECEQRIEELSGLISYDECRPSGEAEPGKPLVLQARVRNDSLKAYTGDLPLTVRFYFGDPARGGFQIAETSVPSLSAPACGGAAYCLPARREVVAAAEWDWSTIMPGLAERGSPIRPLPIYAIVDPTDAVAEGHDFAAPVEVRDCYDSYPSGDGAGGWDTNPDGSDIEFTCPTTNNEGFFLQAFGGSGRTSTDLSVSPSDIEVLDDGSIQVSVHASEATGRVEVRLYRCPTGASAETCLPQTTATPVSAPRTIPAIAKGGTAATRFAGPGVSLSPGTHALWVQVVARDNWESPGGGPFDADGVLIDNQAFVTFTI